MALVDVKTFIGPGVLKVKTYRREIERGGDERHLQTVTLVSFATHLTARVQGFMYKMRCITSYRGVLHLWRTPTKL